MKMNWFKRKTKYIELKDIAQERAPKLAFKFKKECWDSYFPKHMRY